MAAGTSPSIIIDGAEFKPQKGYGLSAIKDAELVAQSPVPNGTEPSEAMLKFQNPYPEFAFDKISQPDYGYSDKALSRITGIPANKPDYIADYQFIALMRCIDFMLKQGYNGNINGNYDTPDSN